jgi:alpha-methylacyl-CoA racemase
VGDYGGGTLFLVSGILAALYQAERAGKGDIVDAAIIDGTNSMMSVLHMLSGLGQWTPERGTNMLDGAWPFYRCYTTKDEKFMAVGPLEAQFFAEMLRLLEIDKADYGKQMDTSKFPDQHAMLEAKFASKTRDEWASVFDGTDACVTPVLTYDEAPAHPQNAARGGLRKQGAFVHPRPAPGFKGTETDPDFSVPGANDAAADIFEGLGYDDAKLAALRETGVTP